MWIAGLKVRGHCPRTCAFRARAGVSRSNFRNSIILTSARHPITAGSAVAYCYYRSPLVACSFQNLSASNALADEAMPARTDTARSAEKIIFMTILLDLSNLATAGPYSVQDSWQMAFSPRCPMTR
jgi:hypothetical protein